MGLGLLAGGTGLLAKGYQRVPPARASASHLRSVPLLVSGIAMSSLGAATLWLAPAVLDEADVHQRPGYDDVDVATDLSGLLLIGAGVPLMVVGSERLDAAPTRGVTVLPWASPKAGGATLNVVF